jgi:predicted enzyme related to lactoylglutathione lyase
MANPLCHFEFICSDVEKSKEFYSKVFDWEFRDVDMSMPYTLVRAGDGPSGHMMGTPPEMPHQGLCAFFQVDDVSETLLQVTEAGGLIICPATGIPNVGSYGMFADPEGVIVGLFNPLK